MPQTAKPVQLKPLTIGAFADYIREAETLMEQDLRPNGAFLWLDRNSKTGQQVREGQIVAQFWAAKGPLKVLNGLIHDWIAAVFIPGATIESVLALIQDYDNYKK